MPENHDLINKFMRDFMNLVAGLFEGTVERPERFNRSSNTSPPPSSPLDMNHIQLYDFIRSQDEGCQKTSAAIIEELSGVLNLASWKLYPEHNQPNFTLAGNINSSPEFPLKWEAGIGLNPAEDGHCYLTFMVRGKLETQDARIVNVYNFWDGRTPTRRFDDETKEWEKTDQRHSGYRDIMTSLSKLSGLSVDTSAFNNPKPMMTESPTLRQALTELLNRAKNCRLGYGYNDESPSANPETLAFLTKNRNNILKAIWKNPFA
jgi:hypothetical protein